MNKTLLKKKITEALQLKNPEIIEIRRTPGGMTNDSYFATVNNEELVIRIPGAGTEELVNRIEEKANLLYGTRLGINPPTLYFNKDTGLKITQKIKDPISITPALAREGNTMQQIIYLFKHLHNTKAPMRNDFKLFSLINHYESLVKDVNDVIFEKISELKKDVIALQMIYESFQITQAPSHIDPVCANIIKNKHEEIYLIDWEYSGMFDPLWDIATLFISLELQRMLMHTIFQDYLWALWSFFKESQGEEVGNEAVMRMDRATENISLYKEIYEEDIVV